ncbi:hypothetical protein DB354_15575 [Opitutus sp. ER46]|nr:hypothetical protein DB354_15575 [Opitutus sp. ER46]
MKRGTHVALMLGFFCCTLWVERPDAIGPLVVVSPYFSISAVMQGQVHIVALAAIAGLVGAGAAVGALVRPASAD